MTMVRDDVVAIKEKIDIVTIIGERVTLKKSGRNMKGLCPFHGEKTPSFFVSPEMQLYKCFGCQASGDVIAFLEAYEGWSFGEVLEMLAKRVGVKLTPYKKSGDEDTRDRLYEILHLAAEYYHYLLTEHAVGEVARGYLKSRGVYQQSINDYMIGYALESWDGLQRFLVGKKGYRIEELEAVGMVIKHEARNVTTPHYYDRFRGRIMFPLKDFAGHLVGFSGRMLEQDSEQAKYINSPETRLYHKSECLFGLSQAKQAIRKADRVVVVEGEMDVIISQQAGVKETVAVKGSALTEAQILHLRKLTKHIVLSMDADEAGQDAIRRGIEVAEKQGMNLAIVRIAGGKDPAEVGREDPKKWKEMTQAAMPVYQFFMEWAFDHNDSKTGTGQKQISQFLAPVWAAIENAVEQAYYVKKLAERLGVGTQVIEDEMMKVKRTLPQIASSAGNETPDKELGRREKLERYLLGLAFQFEDLAAVWPKLTVTLFSEAYLGNLVTRVGEIVTKEPRVNGKQVLLRLPPELQQLAQELYSRDYRLWRMDRETLEAAWTKGLKELSILHTRDRMNQLLMVLSGEEIGDREALLSEYRQLTEELKSLS